MEKNCKFRIIFVSRKAEVLGFETSSWAFSWYLQHSRLKSFKHGEYTGCPEKGDRVL